MSKLGATEEIRRKDLIDKLMILGVFKKGGKHLFECSVKELEQEYRAVKSVAHPHSQMDSIQWVRRKVQV